MSKIGEVKLQLQAKKATPAPPVGSVLGQYGIQLQVFCAEFNDKTKDAEGVLFNVHVEVYKDRKYKICKLTPNINAFIKKKLGINKGSSKPGRDIIQFVEASKVQEIANESAKYMNVYDEAEAFKSIEGTLKSMGIRVK